MSRYHAVTTFQTTDGSYIPIEAIKVFESRYAVQGTSGGDMLATATVTGTVEVEGDDPEAAKQAANDHVIAVIESTDVPIEASIQLEPNDR